MDMDKLQKLVCPHSIVSDEDGEGYALCLKCGSPIKVRLTLEMLNRAFYSLRDG